MYFKDKNHKNNYRSLVFLFPRTTLCCKTQSAAYISALPEIYDNVHMLMKSYETPIDWMLDWIEMKKSVNAGLVHPSFLPFELSDSMKQLGNLALHLWNGNESFNLMSCFKMVDKSSYLCIMEAISIRMQLDDMGV